MDPHATLGEFLRSCRSRLVPRDAGLSTYGRRRRVTGLRREELAQLARVSISYYTRLEQGQAQGASVEVLDAIASALRLDPHERAHLHDLAQAAKARPVSPLPAPEQLSPALGNVFRALAHVPAVVTGRGGDILAWNRLGHALFASHLDFDAPQWKEGRPNTARLVFLDEQVRALYVDWKGKARSVVEYLRLMVGRHPEDPRLAALIRELTAKSPEFATLWLDHRVRACELATHELRHPVAGRLTITQQNLASTDTPDQSLVVITTESGSASEAALRLLAQATDLAAQPARNQDRDGPGLVARR